MKKPSRLVEVAPENRNLTPAMKISPTKEWCMASAKKEGDSCVSAGSTFQEYHPELWTVKKDDIYAAIHAVENGLDYARECLTTHDSNLGRTTLKNRTWAEQIEKDIRHMECTLIALRLCPNDLSSPTPRKETHP